MECLTLLCLQLVLERRVPMRSLPRDMGDGYTGEEEAQKRGGGEDHMSRQTSSAGFSFLFESVP